MSRARLIIGGLLVALVGGVVPVTESTSATPAPADATTDAVPVGTPLRAAWPTLTVGYTLTETGPNAWDPPADRQAAARLTDGVFRAVNVHLMGWGIGNPSPRPGVVDLGELDDRLAVVRATGAEPVITLCCAPDWMKGGTPGRTDWSRLEAAPRPEHFDDFAALSATVAARYPDVRYFQVWNELKGFWRHDLNRWDYEGYLALYRKVYAAVKRVRPDARVGGPYVPIGAWRERQRMSHPSDECSPAWGCLDQRDLDVVERWLAAIRRPDGTLEADFLTVDGTTATRDAGAPLDPLAATEFFGHVTRWLRARTSLPIWWAELYPAPNPRTAPDVTVEQLHLATLQHLADAGARVALLWEPSAPTSGERRFSNLWAAGPDGPEPLALYRELALRLSGQPAIGAAVGLAVLAALQVPAKPGVVGPSGRPIADPDAPLPTPGEAADALARRRPRGSSAADTGQADWLRPWRRRTRP